MISVDNESKYSPFFKAQLKWALQSYRWKQDLSWYYYPVFITKILKLPYKLHHKDMGKPNVVANYENETTEQLKDVIYPIGEKDPHNWILHGHEPGDAKIRIYLQFLEEAPGGKTYLRALEKEESAFDTCDSMYRFLAPDNREEKQLRKFSLQAANMENHVFINSILEKELGPTFMPVLGESLGSSYNLVDVHDPFRTDSIVTIFRQIGVSPYLKMYLFGTNCLKLSQFRHKQHKERESLIIKHLDDTYGRSNVDKIDVKNFYKGVIVPAKKGNGYMGTLRAADNETASVHLTFYPYSYKEKNTEMTCEDFFDKKNKDAQVFLHQYLIFDNPLNFFDKFHQHYPSTINSSPYKIDFFQDFIATSGFGR
jgi:hypothetical protein